MADRKNISRVFRIVALVITLTGLLAHMDVFAGSFLAWKLMYYTIQSNILAAILFGVLVVANARSLRQGTEAATPPWLARFEMVCVIDLLLTFLVYWTLLAPGGSRLWRFDNLSVHLFAPLFCLADFFLFMPRRLAKQKDVFLALVFPLAYVLYSSAAGFCGYSYGVGGDGRPKRFPYFFVDFDRMGLLQVFLYLGLVALMLIALGYGVYYTDRKSGRTTDPACI
jgi:hypothetical protein